MIKIERAEVIGWGHAIRGMRNPLNSWNKSDSYSTHIEDAETYETATFEFFVGEADLNLMKMLRDAGTDHRKFMRMIAVYVDLTAPLYWWKEFDTYKVGTVANSCSTMHKIHAKELTLDDFSHEHLSQTMRNSLVGTIDHLNMARRNYLFAGQREDWWQMIQLLPCSYNQKRTVMLNYEVLANIYKARKNHKLDEWKTFCEWIESLPYAKELICGEGDTDREGS